MKNPAKLVKDTQKVRINRARVAAIIVTLLLVALVGRLAFLMLFDPDDLRGAAIKQYSYEVTIPAKRGIIYDTNMKALAISSTVQNVFISPRDIKTDSQVLIIANGLSEILGVDAATVVDECAKRDKYYRMIKRSISEDEEAAVRKFISDNGLTSIVHLEESSKRFYPYNTLASHVIGVVGTDNTGLMGLESVYDSYLSGINGRSVMGRDSLGNSLPFKYESYIDAEDGYNVISTIDWTIQSILEKYMKETYIDNKPNGSVSGIVMDVHTGEILGMAIYPDFDLNSYATLNDFYEAKLDAFVGTEEEKAAYKSELLNKMWNNTTVTQTYEPGSTFKIITGSIAVEEGLISTTEKCFYCGGKALLPGLKSPVHCWSSHGMQDFKTAIVNSCNPAFMSIGQTIGTETFDKYYKLFGYTQKTGVDLPGETSAIYYGTTGTSFGIVELSIYSFGQTFKTTMIEHIRAVSAIANGGYLVTPHLVKAITDTAGNTVNTYDYGTVRQVITGETARTLLDSLINSHRNAAVSGYNVVAKTGTSEKRDTAETEDYISSCVVFAPAEDPQIAVLLTVDEPTAGPIYGSQVAAPYISKILSEVLPYMGILPDSANIEELVTLDDFRGSDIETAKLVAEDKGLKCVIKGNGSTVVSQLPRMNTSLRKGGTVVLYTDTNSASYLTEVPSLTGYDAEKCISILENRGLNIKLEGIFNMNYVGAAAVSQTPAAGESVLPGTVIEVEFRYDEDME